jgi:hypothetical protein
MSLRTLQFTPDGKSLWTSAADKTFRQSDTVSGKELRTVQSPPNTHSVLGSPDGKFIMRRLLNDSSPYLVDSASGEIRGKVDSPSKEGREFADMVFTPDSGRWGAARHHYPADGATRCYTASADKAMTLPRA